MKIVFSDDAWNDYQYWIANDRRILKRINLLIKEISRDPFSGLGKPESLKHNLSGYWSRRITQEHRIVYRVSGDELMIAQLRYHYKSV
ncbi:MAG TPA: Txe/YoeB family addiction module toxin [Spirochaetales bacterium]|nr:Txe/YoeB family addiction module toxin [Spirochaetales bacterium]